MVGHDQDPGVGGQHRHPVAQLVVGREQAQFFAALRAFDAPGVDDDVLGGRGERHHQRGHADGQQPGLGGQQGHGQQARRDDELGDHHPASTPAEPRAQQRRVQPVD